MNKRLYLHSNDNDTTGLEDINQADVNFNIEDANINIEDTNQKQLSISLLKCTIPNTISYFRISETQPIAVMACIEGNGNIIQVYITENELVAPKYIAGNTGNLILKIPFTLLQDVTDLVSLLNTALDANTPDGAGTAYLEINPTTGYLTSTSSQFAIAFYNVLFTPNSSAFNLSYAEYDPLNVIFYKVLGINTDLPALTVSNMFTYFNNGVNEKNRDIKYPCGMLDRNILLETNLTTDTFASYGNKGNILASIPLSIAIQHSFTYYFIDGGETTTTRESTKFISYENKIITDSHKRINNKNINNLSCKLIYDDGTPIYSITNISYEFEIKYVESNNN